MKALVTGAAGFIGSHLCERLLGLGWTVAGIDNFDDFYDPQIKRRNIAVCLKNKSFQLIEADIRNSTAMDKAVGAPRVRGDKLARQTNGGLAPAEAGVEIIVHLAARAGVRPSIAQPLLYADVNINGTMVLLQLAKKHNVAKFIFGSSSSVYGNPRLPGYGSDLRRDERGGGLAPAEAGVPFSEDDNVDFPISPYAATKKAGELICHTYHHLYGIAITCLRFFTVYGPRQRPDLAIHKFAKLIEQGRPIPVYGDGTAMRDFTYIDDIIDGTVAAINRLTIHDSRFTIYNLGHSHPITVNDLITEIEKALGKKAIKEYVPAQPGDVERTYADITKAARELGYKPRTTIEEGLARFVEWLRSG
jgi:UDP-glucuronate 4-epimerase